MTEWDWKARGVDLGMQRKKAAPKQNAADELRIRKDTTAPNPETHTLSTTRRLNTFFLGALATTSLSRTCDEVCHVTASGSWRAALNAVPDA